MLKVFRIATLMLTLLCLWLCSQRTYALPEGVVARLGKGGISSSDRSIAFSPNGEILAVAAHGVQLYDTTIFAEIAFLETDSQMYSISFSPDGRFLASGSYDNTVKLWDVTTYQGVAILKGHSSWVSSVAFSPNGRLLASGSHDRTVILWDVLSFREVATLKGHNDVVHTVAFSPDGSLLASADRNGNVKLWDVSTQREEVEFSSSFDAWGSVSFSPNGRLLASGGWKEVKLWDIATRQKVATLSGYQTFVRSIAFSPDGSLLASGSVDGTKLWDLSTFQEVATLAGHGLRSVAFSPDGNLLASGNLDNTVKLWSVPTLQEQRIIELTGHSDSVNSVAFSPDGSLLASGSWDRTVRLWDVPTLQEKVKLSITQRSMLADASSSCIVNSVAFSPDGSLLASGSYDGTLTLWAPATFQKVATLAGHSKSVNSVAFSPDGRFLASGSGDKTVKLWDVTTYRGVAMLTGHSDSVNSVAFSPDGSLLASGSGSYIKLWDLSTFQELATLAGHSEMVWSVAFSPDGSLLASGSFDDTIKLWDVSSRQNVATLRPGYYYIDSITFSPDGSLLASSIGLWDVSTLQEVVESLGQQIYPVAFSPDGSLLAGGGSAGVIFLWDMTPYAASSPRPNQPPVASFTFTPESPAANTEVIFDASASKDPDGQIISYQWDFGDKSNGEGEVVKHSYLTEGQYTVTLKVTDNDEAKVVASKQIDLVDVARLKETINVKLLQRPIYPPYLLDVDSFNSALNTIWQNLTDWFRVDDLTDNYDELYFTGIEYDSLRYTALIRARDFLSKGDITNAKRYLEKADTYEKLSQISFQGATHVFETNLEAARIIAQSIKDGCQASVRFGLKFVSPSAAKGADFLYDILDLGIEYYLGNQDEATKNFLMKRAIKLVFNEVRFEKLGGKTVSDWIKNQTGKYLFPVLTEITKSEEWQHALSEVIKEEVSQITKETLIEVTTFITDEAAKAVNSLKAELGSPAEIRIYNSQGQITGLVNGKVMNEIPGSLYDNETVIIFFPTDVYRYEVVGTEKGKYGLRVTSVEDGQDVIFVAADIPISPKATHQYTVDWDALAKSEEGVTVQVDVEGDGNVEYTIVADSTFTQDEYSANNVMPKGKYLTTWGEVKETKLFQNYPNPFNPETWIPYQLSENSEVAILICNEVGILVKELGVGLKEAGLYLTKDRAAYWDGRDGSGQSVSSGIYFYTIRANDFQATKKMAVVR